ncbi:MAG TPA: enoyl-CoA hydratase/isomerase family protein [Trebonia sp.]|nr:enoyl-CoA hydratase/isomerase family protein [Trebonia sp.]
MLDLEERAEIAIVRLAHGKVNALDVELLRAIEQTFASLDGHTAVVLTGAGRSLSAGVDLKRIADGGPQYVREFRPALSAAAKSVFYHPGPVVAAINGHAIAGGCVLAAACDIRLMSGGTIGLTELRVGVPFPGVPLEVMRHVLGPATRRLVLGSDLLAPQEALAVGLIDRITEPETLLDEAVAEAKRLARIGPDVFAFTKRQLQGPARERIEALTVADDEAATRMWASPDVREAIIGFMDDLTQR